jgi:hypothetical protein
MQVLGEGLKERTADTRFPAGEGGKWGAFGGIGSAGRYGGLSKALLGASGATYPPHSAASLKRPSSERPRPKTAFSWAFSALARSEKGISHFIDEVRGEAVMEANSGKARLENRHMRKVS